MNPNVPKVLSSLILSACLVGALASGGCDGDEGGVTAEPIALTEVGDRVIATMCGALFRCCPATRLSDTVDVGTDAASCRQKLARAGVVLQASLSEGVAAGRITYDAAQMGQCLEDLAAQSCQAARAAHDPIDALASCRAASHGTVSTGGSCASSDSCVDGWCDLDSTFVCTAKRATGRACDDDAQCVSGQCTGSSATSGTCITATPDGLCSL